MKRYWLFIYMQYYPSGGMNDYIGNYDTVEECHEKMKEMLAIWDYEHHHILDTQEKKIVDMFEYNEEKKDITFEELYKSNHPYGR